MPEEDDYDWEGLPNARALGIWHQQRSQRIQALPWVADGLNYHEAEAAADLIRLAFSNEPVFNRILSADWIDDPLPDSTRAPLLHFLTETVRAIDQPFFQRRTAYTCLLTDSPFLNQADPWDADALQSLYFLLRRPETADLTDDFIRNPAYADGMDDSEARRLSVLSAAYHQDAEQIVNLLQPGRLHLETDRLDTPAGRSIALSILRLAENAPGREPSPTMTDLKGYLLHLENYLDAPPPHRPLIPSARHFNGWPTMQRFDRAHIAVVFLEGRFGEAEVRGFNNGQTVTMLHRDDRQELVSSHILAHEVAHYWFGGPYSAWVNEGLAEYLAFQAAAAVHGRGYRQSYPGCSRYATLAEMDRENPQPGHPGYRCSYELGYNLFSRLAQTVPDFQQRLRQFYQDSFRTRLDIAALRRRFPESALAGLYGD